MRRSLAVFWVIPILLAGCSSSERVEKLKAALEKARVPLREAVGIAETNLAQGAGLKAALLVDADPVYSIGAVKTGALQDVRVDIVVGDVLSVHRVASSDGPCPGAVSLAEAIVTAEAKVDGRAVSIAPDDDDACNREVQVLSGDVLWEVKISPRGKVIETEESDDD